MQSEGDARALGRFVYRKRLLAFLRLRCQLREDAKVGGAVLCSAGPWRGGRRAGCGASQRPAAAAEGGHCCASPCCLLR